MAFKPIIAYRHYDPYSQKFLSEDPIGFSSKDPNLYRYVHNGPLVSKDPSGNGPVAGGLCAVVDIGANSALAISEYYANDQLVDSLDFAIRNTIKELDERCLDDSVRRSYLKKQLLELQIKKAEALLKGAGAFPSGIGGTLAGGGVCLGLLALPFIP